jgi:tetratricopeptide (TPR) repeat protein/transglutaminase-like putative cysteine protease
MVADSTLRARVQSDAGVKHFGVMVFPYQQANEEHEILFVRVIKPDGTVVTTPAENIQDMPADITREAPFYSDLREKHVAVRGLSVGDTLEYQGRTRVLAPIVPGQFWMAYDFDKSEIVLDEEVEVSVPRDRQVKVKSADVQPTVHEEGSRRIYLWKTANRQRPTEEQSTTLATQLPPPAVQVTTFQNLAEVGRWYGGLQRDRVEPTAEIRAKAAELIRDAKNDTEKLQAIYKYVALNFRYIGIAFGIGRYQPHPAGDVLANQYGDCKDKHTLLAALLKAVGLTAYPALINASRKTDPDMPSPSQFDHIISAIPQGDGYLWLDTTTEVAPFGFLLSNLRDKQALVIPEYKPPLLLKTPEDSPFPSSVGFQIVGKLSDSGTLEAKVERNFRGDTEVLLRAAFRRVPQPQWKDLVQQISYGSRFAGDVSNVAVSTPEDISSAFRFSYDYTRKDYPDWANRRIGAPCPPLGLPPLKEEKTAEPLPLGTPVEFVYDGKITLPGDYIPRLPSTVELKEDFAEYYSTYAFANGVLHAQRRLTIKVREIPRAKFEQYRKFQKAANDDENAFINLESAMASGGEKRNPEADRLFEEGRQALLRRDFGEALDYFKKTLDIDPKYKGAWGVIGYLQMELHQIDEGLRAFRKEIEVNPSDPRAYKGLGFALMAMNRNEEAIQVWQDLRKVDPKDRDAPANLGALLVRLKKYSEAVPVLQSAAELNPKSPHMNLALGSAYLETGESEQALVAYQKAADLDPAPNTWNAIAYSLAEKNQKLSEALRYAEMAVKAQESRTDILWLERLEMSDLRIPGLLGAIWDTVGWVHFRLGNLDKAEKYIAAAWNLSQDAIEADHLGQIYEKQGKKQVAIRAYSWALAASGGEIRLRFPAVITGLRGSLVPEMQDTRNRLLNLVGSNSRIEALVRDAGGELSQMRTVRLKPIVPKLVTAEFFVLLSPGPKVEEVKFISGAEELRGVTKQLAAAKFDAPFPDEHKTKILRRGILMCHPGAVGCEFVLFTPDAVQSLN